MFETKLVSRQEIVKLGEPGGGGNIADVGISFLVYSAWGLAPKDEMDVYRIQGDNADAHLFSYMCRRFGFPISYCDDYKQIGQWYLTTPTEGLYLSVYPFMGTGFGYMSSIKGLEYSIYSEQQVEIDAYWQRLKSWAKEIHLYNFYSVYSFERFGLPTEKRDGGEFFIKGEELTIAIDEYNKWQKENNLPDLAEKEENDRFFAEFHEYKENENEKIVDLYKEVGLSPDEVESKTKNNVIAALQEAAKDLMRYTNIRDVYFNAIGYQNDAMDTQLTTYFGTEKDEDGKDVCTKMYVDYANPNEYIKIYQRGLELDNEAKK